MLLTQSLLSYLRIAESLRIILVCKEFSEMTVFLGSWEEKLYSNIFYKSLRPDKPELWVHKWYLIPEYVNRKHI